MRLLQPNPRRGLTAGTRSSRSARMSVFGRVSGPGAFHPEVLTDPYVNVPAHTAPSFSRDRTSNPVIASPSLSGRAMADFFTPFAVRIVQACREERSMVNYAKRTQLPSRSFAVLPSTTRIVAGDPRRMLGVIVVELTALHLAAAGRVLGWR